MKFIQAFHHVFGKKGDVRVFFAPGRVNLIGEHIDYNGGHVLPCALEIGTYVVARKRKDHLLRFYSENFSATGMIEVNLQSLLFDERHGWANYPKGIFQFFKEQMDVELTGMDLYYTGTIPNGAGLSSSASIELVTAFMINEMFSVNLDRTTLVKMAQQVENDYIGVQCGIMDQFAVGFGKRDQAILLNCDTLSYLYTPLPLQQASIVIVNSNKKRELADSAYNDRRKTCEKALAKIKQKQSIHQLVDLKVGELENVKSLLTSVEFKRVRHVVTENERTKKAVELLRSDDLSSFGVLMNESHLSLRDDYEVTGFELDSLVEAAWQHPGTIGARMTGAGFGGCTVNIVKNNEVSSFVHEVGQKYESKTGKKANFYVVKPSDGVKELTEQVE